MSRDGYTLIELLVVIAILAALTAMVVSANPRQGNAQAVELAAAQVCSVLHRARATAIAEHSSTAVVFNIQNAAGSTGRVINNRSGGHWCRILRAGRTPINNNGGTVADIPPLIVTGDQGVPPVATSFYDTWPFTLAPGALLGNGYLYPTFAHVVEEIRADWISEKYSLPAGQVRFLALGDSDEGPRQRARTNKGYGYGTTYPRPYFGWFDTATHRLYPWGGYDPTLPAVASYGGLPAVSTYSGLCFQGPAEAAIPDSRNPADVMYQVDWNANGIIGGADAERGPENAWYLRHAGAPRALVDGEWADFAIVFESDGSAWFPPMKCNRRWYTGDAGVSMPYGGTSISANLKGFGPGDAKAWQTWDNGSQSFPVPNGESIHYARHTSRAFITLAPDSRDDRDTFDSASQALRTLLPMHRVYVSTTGSIGSFSVRHDDDALAKYTAAGHTLWPANPAVLQMSSAADQTWVEQNDRFGWLHTVNANAGTSYWDLVPRGTPITDQVSTEMMTRRIWWLDP